MIKWRRQVVWAIAASLLLAAVVMGYGLYQTPRYEAAAKVLVGQKPAPSDCAHGICLIPNASAKGIETFTPIVARAIPTTPVARAVVKRLNLPPGSAVKVAENTSVKTDPGSMFVDVSYTDTEPKRAQQVANAIGRVASQKLSEMSLGENRLMAAQERAKRDAKAAEEAEKKAAAEAKRSVTPPSPSAVRRLRLPSTLRLKRFIRRSSIRAELKSFGPPTAISTLWPRSTTG
jgi:capsular polysaccharide biosynthesis protein